MFQFYNANPRGRHVNDCTVRAISLATGEKWDIVYRKLSEFAQAQCIMPDDVIYIDEYLDRHFDKIYACKRNNQLTVGDFAKQTPYGTYLITMSGHITCMIDGVIYDTFNPSERFVWGIYRV